jgi:hypothetical protein
VGGGNLSFLITWNGSDTTLLPAMFVCHYDVVPTDETRANTVRCAAAQAAAAPSAACRLVQAGATADTAAASAAAATAAAAASSAASHSFWITLLR